MAGTGKLYVDQISSTTNIEDYAGNSIKPSGTVYSKAARIILGDGSNNVNANNYVDAMALDFSDFPGLTVSGTQINIDPNYPGIYQCCFTVSVNGGSARCNAGFQWDIDGTIQSEMYLSNYNRQDTAQQGGTHNTSSDGGCQIFNVSNYVRIRGSTQGAGGTITTVGGSVSLIYLGPAA